MKPAQRAKRRRIKCCLNLSVAEEGLKVVQRKTRQEMLLSWTAELKTTMGRESPGYVVP